MNPDTHRRIVSRLPDRLAYWYAERFGEHPECSECDAVATWILFPESDPRCIYHSEQGMFGGRGSSVIGMIRDVKPEDHFGDHYPHTHD